jgi:hypothetical protein
MAASNNNNNLGEGGGRSVGLTDTYARREEGEKGLLFLLARAGLSSYLRRPCPMCIILPKPGVVSTPSQYSNILTEQYTWHLYETRFCSQVSLLIHIPQ